MCATGSACVRLRSVLIRRSSNRPNFRQRTQLGMTPKAFNMRTAIHYVNKRNGEAAQRCRTPLTYWGKNKNKFTFVPLMAVPKHFRVRLSRRISTEYVGLTFFPPHVYTRLCELKKKRTETLKRTFRGLGVRVYPHSIVKIRLFNGGTWRMKTGNEIYRKWTSEFNESIGRENISVHDVARLISKLYATVLYIFTNSD